MGIAPSDYTLAGDPASTVICVGMGSTAAAGDNSGYQFLREAMVMRVVQSPNGNVTVPCQDADPSMFQTCNRRAADFDPAPGMGPSYVTPTTADQGRLFYIEPLFEPLPSPEYSPPPFTCQGQPLIQLRHIAEQEAAYLQDCKEKQYLMAAKKKKKRGKKAEAGYKVPPVKFSYKDLAKKRVIVDSEVPQLARKKTVFL